MVPIKKSTWNNGIRLLEEKILAEAKRLQIDLKKDEDRAALLQFQEDVDSLSEDGIFEGSSFMDGQTDATYFLSLAFNLFELIRNAPDNENLITLGEIFYLVGMVGGIIGDDRTKHICPSCIARSYASSLGKYGADVVHNKPNGSREKRSKIRELWASGKYTSRDICAEQECAALAMSFSTARKALRGTPDPT